MTTTSPPTVVYDTNVIVALLSPTDAFHEAAKVVAQVWEAKQARTAISTITWAELCTGAIRRGKDAEALLTAFCRVAIDDVVPVSREIANIAAGYRSNDLSLRLPDALVIATGRFVGAHTVLTGDKQLPRVDPELVTLLTC